MRHSQQTTDSDMPCNRPLYESQANTTWLHCHAHHVSACKASKPQAETILTRSLSHISTTHFRKLNSERKVLLRPDTTCSYPQMHAPATSTRHQQSKQTTFLHRHNSNTHGPFARCQLLRPSPGKLIMLALLPSSLSKLASSSRSSLLAAPNTGRPRIRHRARTSVLWLLGYTMMMNTLPPCRRMHTALRSDTAMLTRKWVDRAAYILLLLLLG